MTERFASLLYSQHKHRVTPLKLIEVKEVIKDIIDQPPSKLSKAFSSSYPLLSKAFVTTSSLNPISIKRVTFPLLTCGEAYLLTHYFAWLLNCFRFYLYSLATTASWGSLGSGTHKSAWSESKAVLMVKAGDHSSFKISRQMAPVTEEMLGCQIFV